MRRIVYLLVIGLALGGVSCASPSSHERDTPPPLWGELRAGPYDVGFTSHWLIDEARTYAVAHPDGGGYGAWRALADDSMAGDAPDPAGNADAGAAAHADADADAAAAAAADAAADADAAANADTATTALADASRALPRPLLVNVWYPAPHAGDAARMTHGDYLDIAPRGAMADAPGLVGLADALSAFARGVIAEQLLDAPETELDAEGAACLAEALATPTAAVRDAPRSPGSFPLVLLHGGAFSSFEDNAALAEWLASQGFVVVGSAYQDADFNVDGLDDSYADLALLVAHARATLPVREGPVGLVGHSFGAHATLRFVARPDGPVGAAVSLDTTQDQASLLDPRWRWAGELARRPEAITVPILFTANPHAFFELGDALVHSERAYLTLRDLDHDGFTAQGVWGARLDARRGNPPPRSSSGGGPVPTPYVPAVERSFAALCEGIGAFLAAHLRGERAPWDARLARWGATPLGGEALHVEHVPAGVAGPAPYTPGTAAPPTPRQVRAFLDAHGAMALADELLRFADADPPPPVHWRMFAFHLLWELVARERDDDALALWRAYAHLAPDVVASLASQEDVFRRFGYTDYADVCLRALRLLAPDDPATRAAEAAAP